MIELPPESPPRREFFVLIGAAYHLVSAQLYHAQVLDLVVELVFQILRRIGFILRVRLLWWIST